MSIQNIEMGNGDFNFPSSKQVQVKNLEKIDIKVIDVETGCSRIFTCPSDLIVKKMKYLNELSGRKIDEMDVSISCDLEVFQWIMLWLNGDKPKLQNENVIKILIACNTLKMEELTIECLKYFRENINEVIKCSKTLLYSLNEDLMHQIVICFKNIELDSIEDEKDRIKSRLYCSFIKLLGEKKPDHNRGHFSSLSTLFKCNLCLKVINSEFGLRVSCKRMKMTKEGNFQAFHEPDKTWKLGNYVIELHKQLLAWNKVYWRLWGESHYGICSLCGFSYPLCASNWCQYHPVTPMFPNNDMVGFYPCCGLKTYKFEPIESENGCSLKTHQPAITDYHSIFDMKIDLICLDPPKDLIIKQNYNTNLFRNKFFFGPDPITNKPVNSGTQFCVSYDSSSGDDHVRNSKEPASWSHRNKKKKNKRFLADTSRWNFKLSARQNQDNQRDAEEKLIKSFVGSLTNRMENKSNRTKFKNTLHKKFCEQYELKNAGGIYTLLETEFKEVMKGKEIKTKGKYIRK